MIVTCPSCSANYRINANIVDPVKGRIVRCSACGNSWRIYPPQDMIDAKKEEKKSSKTVKYRFLPILLIVLCMNILALGFVYLFRQDIVKLLPQTERFYHIIGVDTSITGISLVMPYLEKINHSDGRVSLLIQGSFLNSHHKDTLKIPPLKIILLNNANLPIARFIKSDFVPEALTPGGRSDFTFEIPDLPPDAVDVRIELKDK